YGPVSLLCWFVALTPDLATLRDRAHYTEANHLRNAGNGLARLGSTLAPLSVSLSAAGGTGDASGAFGAHGGELRLRDCDRSRLAHHDFPAVFRRGGHLFGFRDGADDRDPTAQGVRPGRLHHHAASRKHGY